MNPINDIIPPGSEGKKPKRSIRDVPLPEKKQNKIDELLRETADFRADHPHRQASAPVSKKVGLVSTKSTKPAWSSGASLWISILLLLIVVTGGLLFFFRGAKVAITLKTGTFPIDLIATSTSDSETATGTLPYKILPVQKEGAREVNATGASTNVEKKASGTIIIYNNYNSSSQALIVPTRFETSAGLVYRIDQAVTVPGMSIVNGKSVPGSVEAVVYADKPGPAYNIDKADFTIPGFKGTPKYEGFYARSKTAMTGGFSGTIPKVSDADLKTANDDLRAALEMASFADIDSQKPEGTVFFKDGIRTSYTTDITPAANGKATLKGVLKTEALLFEKSAVEDLIAESRNGEKYRFDNLESLTLSIKNQNSITSFISGPVLSISLVGTLTTGQSFDEEALKRALSDKSRTQLQEILRMYPEIIKAEATLRPFWSKSFPNNPDRIKIIVTKE